MTINATCHQISEKHIKDKRKDFSENWVLKRLALIIESICFQLSRQELQTYCYTSQIVQCYRTHVTYDKESLSSIILEEY